MKRRRVLAAGVVLAVLAVGVTLGVLRSADGSDDPRLAGATLLSDGGDAELSSLTTRYEGGMTLDDLQISDVWRLDSGSTNDFWLFAPNDDALVRAGPTGDVIDIGVNYPLGASITIGPDGRTLRAYRPENSQAPGDGSDVVADRFKLTGEWHYESAFAVGALAPSEDDTVLAGSRDDATIDLLTEGEPSTRLLGPPGDPDARVHWNEPLGPVVALLQLPDDRVVFVANTDGGEQLHLLDEGNVRPIDTGTTNPVSSVAAEATSERGDEAPPITTRLAPAPDGRVLTIGLADDGHPRISAVDVDSGDVEVLADLEGVEPSVEQPVSAVAVGDDLIFLAEDRLWKKEGVFG